MANGRRRRQPRKPVEACLDPTGTPQTPEGWPDAQRITAVLDVDTAALDALAGVEAGDILAVLQTMPVQHRNFVVHSIGLHSAGSVNRGMAAQLLAQLRRMDKPGRSTLLRGMVGPLLVVFDKDDLDGGDWAVLGGDSAVDALRRLAEFGEFTHGLSSALDVLPVALLRAGLVTAIGARVASAAAALAFLARDDDNARAAHEQLRAEFPAMPEIPARALAEVHPRHRLVEAGLLPGGAMLDHARLTELLETNFADDVAGPGEPADPTDVARRSADTARQLRDGWADLARSVTAVAEQLAGGALPDLADLTRATDFVEDAGRVIGEAEALLDGEEIGFTRTGLERAETVLRRFADPPEPWLVELAGLHAPPTVEEAAERVRAMAHRLVGGDDDPDLRVGLANLHTLIGLSAASGADGSVDYAAVGEARAAAAEHLPVELVGLVNAAMMGHLTVTGTSSAPVGPPSQPVAAGIAPTTSGRVPTTEAPTGPEAPTGTEERPGAEPVTTAGPPRHEVTREQPVEAVVDRPGATVVVDPDPGEVSDGRVAPTVDLGDIGGPGDRGGADDLGELDELLADGAAVRLAVATGMRRPDPTEPEPPGRSSPAERQTPPDAADRADSAVGADEAGGGNEIDVAELEAGLLRSGRFGLAADLREVSGAPPAHVRARRLAAYGAHLCQPIGPLAAAFADESAKLSRDLFGDDRAGQVLSWASGVRVAVLAPSAGAARLIAEFMPCLYSRPALREVGQAFAEASRAGLVVPPEAASAVGALSATEGTAAALAQTAMDLPALARRRTIKYELASQVYQQWMSPGGPLRELLDLVAENDPDRLATVSETVVRLRGRVDRAIEDSTSTLRRNKHVKIVAGARSTLINRWNEAVDTAARWVEAAERVAEGARRLRGDHWQAGPLATLRARVREIREAALAELTEMVAEEPGGVAEAATRLVNDALRVCDGEPPVGGDVDPTFAAHGELLASGLPLDPTNLLPADGWGPEALPALVDLVHTPPSWGDVYAARAQAGDHDLTAVLVEALKITEPRLAAGLELRRDTDVAGADADVAERVRTVESLVDSRRLAGALDDDAWSALSARVAALRARGRRDYGRMRRELAAIESALDAALAAKIEAMCGRIEARAAESTVVADAAETLMDLTRRGQIASAEEYLEQALSGGQPPTLGVSMHHLARFFPAVPDLTVAEPRLLGQLREVLRGAAPAPAVAKLGRLAGVEITGLTGIRRRLGQRALGSWAAFTGQAPSAGDDLTGMLRDILHQAGLEFGSAQNHRQGSGQVGRRWVTLSRVGRTTRALHPVLGSAISPEGSTLRVLLVHQAASPATVVEWMSGEPADHTVLVLWFAGALSADDRRAIANAARGRPRPPLLLLDEAALAYLVVQPEPRRATFGEIALPFTAVSPYADTPGNAPREMFYGRTDERAAVLDLAGPSIVYGGRQLGKSALLRDAERRFGQESRHRAAVLTSIFTIGAEGHPEQLWQVLWPKLATVGVVPANPPAEGSLADAVHDHILDWLGQHPSRALLILLDEADVFLDADAENNLFTNVDMCRRIREESGHRAKFVFAGLHRTARFESLPNQPLSHFGRPVSIGPLRPQHAYELLTEPLAAMGFRFADETAIPARILALTNNMPALLQLFGAALVAHLTSRPVGPAEPPGLITDEDVDAVLEDTELREAFREKYVLTLNLDHRYLVIALAVARAAHERGIDTSLSLADLSTTARRAWPEGFATCKADNFRGLVTECVDLGVLAIDNGRYRMRTPTVLRLLGTEEEVEEALYHASERLSIPSAGDVGSYRRRIADSTARSPLTEAQLGRIFRERGGVFVVTGSAALGVDRVIPAIEQAYADGMGRLGAVRRSSPNPDSLRRTVEMLTAQRSLVLVDAVRASSTALRELLDVAAAAVGGRSTSVSVSVAIVVSGANAAGWVEWTDRVELTRLDPVGLRLWSDEDGLPFRDDTARAELMAVTGGWPRLLARVAEQSRRDVPVTSGNRILADLARWLSGPGARDLVDAVGVGPRSGALGRVFASAVELTDSAGEDAQALVELLGMVDTEDLAAAATAAGFRSLDDVVAVLSALGALVDNPDGTLRAEPVLAAAIARVPAS